LALVGNERALFALPRLQQTRGSLEKRLKAVFSVIATVYLHSYYIHPLKNVNLNLVCGSKTAQNGAQSAILRVKL